MKYKVNFQVEIDLGPKLVAADAAVDDLHKSLLAGLRMRRKEILQEMYEQDWPVDALAFTRLSDHFDPVADPKAKCKECGREMPSDWEHAHCKTCIESEVVDVAA